MSVLVSDSFNRADSTTTLGTTDSYAGGTAKTWVPKSGQTWGILSNQAYAVTGTNPLYATVDAGVSDFSITVTFPVYADQFVCFFRVNTTSNTGLAFNATGRKLQSFSGSTFTNIAATTGNLANNTTIKVTCQGSSITVYENGVQIISATSTINQTSTLHGLGNWRTSGTTGGNGVWDNFNIESIATGGTDATITAIAAIATSSAIAPTVTAQQNATVTSVIASSVADGIAPTVSAQKQVTITSVVANSTATALAPAVGSTTLVSAIVASAAAAGIVPIVNAVRNIEIIGSIASALAAAGVPRIPKIGWSPIAAASTAWRTTADTPTTWRESTVDPTIWR